MKTKLLIEQHFHGCFGIDFNKASVDDILYLSKEILKYGIGGIFPTIVTDSVENTKRAIKNIKEASQKQTSDMAKILGIHLEGIFINPEKKGIHNPKHFLAPTIENYKLIEDDFIKIVTLAPEMCEAKQLSSQAAKESGKLKVESGKLDNFQFSTFNFQLDTSNLINYLTSQGIKVQAGHCTGGDLTGCSGVTHLFNAMSGITHRGKSTALSALINDDIYTEIIADGVHVSDDALKLLFKTKPLDKIILISDCLPCTKAAKQLSSQAAKLDNSEILQIQQTDKNLSTFQPFNHSTNNYPSPQPSPSRGEGACHDSPSTFQPFNPSTEKDLSPYRPVSLSPSIMQFTFADETIYYDGKKATSKEGTLAGSTTLLPDIIKRLAILFEDKSGKWKVENGKLEQSAPTLPSPVGRVSEGQEGVELSETSLLPYLHTSIKQLVTNPYTYHNIDLKGSIEWDEDWNIIKINNL